MCTGGWGGHANAFWAIYGVACMLNEKAFFKHWGLIGSFLLVAWIDLHDGRLGASAASGPSRPARGVLGGER